MFDWNIYVENFVQKIANFNFHCLAGGERRRWHWEETCWGVPESIFVFVCGFVFVFCLCFCPCLSLRICRLLEFSGKSCAANVKVAWLPIFTPLSLLPKSFGWKVLQYFAFNNCRSKRQLAAKENRNIPRNHSWCIFGASIKTGIYVIAYEWT